MVWNSPDALYTFYNCISYPMISTAAAHGQISTEDLGLLEKFDIIVNDTMPANASNVDAWPVISGCLREMCFRYKGQGNEAACPLSHYVFRSWGDAEVNDWEFLQMVCHAHIIVYAYLSHLLRQRQDAICVTDPLAFNADIGGPGVRSDISRTGSRLISDNQVLLSFSQQSALLLAMWLFLSLMRCTHFLAYCQLWYGHRRHYHRSKRWRLAIDAAARMTTQWTFPNVTAATISALSTFYATQVFFLITLQAASHFAINNSILLGARNFREVFVSFGLLAFISASGMHPVILALFTLRKDQQGLSWFPLLISSACALISWISGLVTYSRIFKGTDLLQDGYNPQQCGGINPGKNCLTEDFAVSNKYFSQSGDLWWDTPGLSNVMSPVSGVATFAAILLLIVEKLILEKEKVISVEPFSQKRLWRARTWMRTLGQFNMYRYLGLLLAIAEAWHVYATFCLMFIVSSVLRWPSYDITETWTLGQIMAVAIWAPVMIDWIRVLLGR